MMVPHRRAHLAKQLAQLRCSDVVIVLAINHQIRPTRALPLTKFPRQSNRESGSWNLFIGIE